MHLVFEEHSRKIQFYPNQSGWDPSVSPRWSMHITTDPLNPRATRPSIVSAPPGFSVLSPHSDVVRNLHTIFVSLETSGTNLLATASHQARHHVSQRVEIELPRYNLQFFIDNHGHLQCQDLPGFSISAVQAIGTLCGLKNKLILENKDHPELRKVIIPYGTVHTSASIANYTHPVVTITPCTNPGIRAFIYDVDGVIGRLVGDGTLSSWFMLVYLHILTSYWLNDPLLHNTGVQQGLKMLRSANSFSFMQLAKEHRDILTKIADIQSVRHYYPEHLTCMETITWNSILYPLGQNLPFARLVGDIFEHGRHQQLFHDDSVGLRLKQKGITPLRERAEFRSARYVLDDITGLRNNIKGASFLCWMLSTFSPPFRL